MKRKLLALGLALLLALTAGCGAVPAPQATPSPSLYAVQTPPERPSPSPTASPTPTPTPLPTPTPTSTPEPSVQPVVQDIALNDYILNTNTHKFHKPGCSSVDQMKESNKQAYTGLREDVIARGYSPCGRCKP